MASKVDESNGKSSGDLTVSLWKMDESMENDIFLDDKHDYT